MICEHCGREHPDGAFFCVHCGERTARVLHSAVIAPAESPATTEPARNGSLKVPALILTVLSVLGLILYFLFPKSSSTQTPETGNIPGVDSSMLWFYNHNGSLHFDEDYYQGSSELTVPSNIGGIPVRAIGEYCFFGNTELTTVILPDTLTAIEEGAFYGCTSMRGIYIPKGLTHIWEDAFANCTALEAISIPSTVLVLDESAFDGCSSLKYVFFDGTTDQWNAIYHGTTETTVTVYCTNGQCSLGTKE